MHPAVHVRIEPDGRTEWLDAAGHRHRHTGPALVHADGSEEWFLHGEHHRDDGPASQGHGGRHWLQHGVYHRLDGPAIEWRPGGQPDKWYINGTCVSSVGTDRAALEDLSAREPRLLPLVLGLWDEDGPAIAELVTAVLAACS